MQPISRRNIQAGIRLSVKFSMVREWGVYTAGQSESAFVRQIRSQTRASDRSSMMVLIIKKIQEENGPIYGPMKPQFPR